MLQTETCKHVGALIRARRKTRGLSQEALGDEAGRHRTYLSGLERGL